jgi:hypothetical protein
MVVVRFPAKSNNCSLPYTLLAGSGAHPTFYPVSISEFSRRVKRPEREAVHSNLSNAEVKNAWNYTSSFTHNFIPWCLLTTTRLRNSSTK